MFFFNPVFWWQFMDPTHTLTISPSDYLRYGFLKYLPRGKYPEYECIFKPNGLIAYPSMNRIWCYCTFNRNTIMIEYLQSAGEQTLAFRVDITDKEALMLWKMFIPYASFMSENYTVRGFSLETTFRMLKVVSHMTHGDHLLKTELHKELKTRFL